jgi:phosphoribosylanthranilate isomerase
MRAAEALGARYVGLIVEVARSPRSLSRPQARLMARAAHASPVLVTTSTDPSVVAEMAGFVQPAVVQLHGLADAELVARVRSMRMSRSLVRSDSTPNLTQRSRPGRTSCSSTQPGAAKRAARGPRQTGRRPRQS